MTQALPHLLSPVRLGDLDLRNRVLMAPMTRSRAVAGHVPSPLAPTYYAQRASAGLIVSEATQVSPQGIGYPNTPGIHSDAQVVGWSAVTRAVHEKGGLVVAQLWHVGRVSLPMYQPGGALPVAPSAIAHEGQAYTAEGAVPYGVPRALETEEIPGIVEDFANGARRAKDAGFDGIEIHGANGYLIDQFLRDGSNQRTDRYGGSLANRSRFLLEILDAVTAVWPGGRVGVRLSLAHTLGSLHDSDPTALAAHLARALDPYGLAYLHLIEAVSGPMHRPGQVAVGPTIRANWKGGLILNGGYDALLAEAAIAAGAADAISFGTPFIANPDLPERFRLGASLRSPERASFYGGDAKGYIDYPAFAAEQAAVAT